MVSADFLCEAELFGDGGWLLVEVDGYAAGGRSAKVELGGVGDKDVVDGVVDDVAQGGRVRDDNAEEWVW